MHQHRLVAGGDVIGVDAVNGEVECWGVVGGVPQQRSGLDRRTISSKQQITGINVLGFLPGVVGDVPELMILGRGNRCVTDFELDERVRVRPRRPNSPGAGLIGLGCAGGLSVNEERVLISASNVGERALDEGGERIGY